MLKQLNKYNFVFLFFQNTLMFLITSSPFAKYIKRLKDRETFHAFYLLQNILCQI